MTTAFGRMPGWRILRPRVCRRIEDGVAGPVMGIVSGPALEYHRDVADATQIPVNASAALRASARRPLAGSGWWRFFRDWLLFVREGLSDPRSIGSVMPSSPALARRMAAMTRWDDRTWILELGAGTGVVTQALLSRGAAAGRLLAIERSEPLAALLRRRFPAVRVVCGDAASLRQIVQKAAPRARQFAVVSSLPFRSLPQPVGAAIRGEIAGLLARGGQWTQFTYALSRREVPAGFMRDDSSTVWVNVPPARVDVFAVKPA